MKVLVTGATGLIGKEIGKALVRKGHQVVALSRNKKKATLELPFPCEIIEADLTHENLSPQVLKGVEAVIHLAGENVGDSRWTPERKERILTSRVDYTRHLIKSLPDNFKVFISASAVGYYGDRASEALTEKSVRGAGFLADVCEQWEQSVLGGQHKSPKARFVILRTGVVLAPFGGALMKMLAPFQMGIGGILGSGRQWLSWIHLQDLVQMYMRCLEDSSLSGVVNAVAPQPVTNAQFTVDLCEALDVRKGPPVPALALKFLYGEMGSVILDSQKVQSLYQFDFRFPILKEALQDCVGLYRGGHAVFYAEQFLALPRFEVFPFYSKAENLESITPPLLSFHVQKVSTPEIQKGTEIDYTLKIHGVPVKWKTLIEEWDPQNKFVDTQVKGPYTEWHHTHVFEEFAGGTLMTDIVRYKVPLGILGHAVSGSFVRGDVEKIFSYRREKVPELLQTKNDK